MSEERKDDVELIDSIPKHLGTIPLSDIELVSCSNAIAPLKEIVPSIEQFADSALDFAESKKNNEDNLTIDEIAAINLLTQEHTDKAKSLSLLLNDRMKDANRKNIQSFLPYLKLLYSALFKLKPVDCSKHRLLKEIEFDKGVPEEGSFVRWWSFCYCTQDVNLFNERISKNGKSQVVVAINTVKAVDIRKYSSDEQEYEMVVLPPVQFKVLNAPVKIKNTTLVELSENYPENSFRSYYLPWGEKFKLNIEKKDLEEEKGKFAQEKKEFEEERKRYVAEKAEHLRAVEEERKKMTVQFKVLEEEKAKFEQERKAKGSALHGSQESPATASGSAKPRNNSTNQMVTYGKDFVCNGCTANYKFGKWMFLGGFDGWWDKKGGYLKGSKDWNFKFNHDTKCRDPKCSQVLYFLPPT